MLNIIGMDVESAIKSQKLYHNNFSIIEILWVAKDQKTRRQDYMKS